MAGCWESYRNSGDVDELGRYMKAADAAAMLAAAAAVCTGDVMVIGPGGRSAVDLVPWDLDRSSDRR